MHRWVEKVVDVIVDVYDPDQIVLFGSAAKGADRRVADTDMIVIRNTEVRCAYCGVEVYEALSRFPINFDLFFYTHRELKEGLTKPNSLIESVWETGVCLYRRP